MAPRSRSSPISSFQPCIQLLPTTSLANHGRALQSNIAPDGSSIFNNNNVSDHWLIFDTTGQSDSLLYNVARQTITSRLIPYPSHHQHRSGGRDEEEREQQSSSSQNDNNNKNIVFLKSRYIFALDSNSRQAYDLERQAPTSVPWDASILAKSTTGYTVLCHHPSSRRGGTFTRNSMGGVYVFGGRDKRSRRMRADVQFLSDATISMHQQQSTSISRCWEPKPSMNIARRDAAAVAIGNLIYIIGGTFWDPFQARYRECPYTEIFDGERWTFGPSLNVPRQKHCAVVVGNNTIVVLGGQSTLSSSSSSASLIEDVEIWNTTTDYFAVLPSGISPARANFDAVVRGEGGGREIYLIGGGTRAIGKVTLDLAKLTPDQLCYFAPAVDAEAPPASLMHSNRDDKTSATSSKTLEDTIVTKIDTESKVLLPLEPSLPSPPVATTLQDRHKAMRSYIANLMAVQEEYRQTVQESKDRITQHYERIIEQQSKLRDQAINEVQFHSTAWLKDTERLTRMALADVQLMETQLQSKKVSDTKVTAFLKQNDQDEFYDNIPSQLRCPLTLDLMTDPVVAADGNTYERSALQDWYKNSKRQQAKNSNSEKKFVPRSPLTGAELPTEDFFPVHTLRSMCQQFAKQIDETKRNKNKHDDDDDDDHEMGQIEEQSF